jgi:hypothetical protein
MDMMTSLVNGLWANKFFPTGYQSLAEAIAKTLPDVRTSSPVTAVKRPGAGAGGPIQLTVGGKVEEFDRIIVTTAPSAAAKMLDLSPEEKDLFSQVGCWSHRWRGLGGRLLPPSHTGSSPLTLTCPPPPHARSTQVETVPYLVTLAEAGNLTGTFTPLANGVESRIGHYTSSHQAWSQSNLTVVR